jgi:hypothetical protein
MKFADEKFREAYLDLLILTCIVMRIYFNVILNFLYQLNFEILVGQPFATWFEGCIRIDNKKNQLFGKRKYLENQKSY